MRKIPNLGVIAAFSAITTLPSSLKVIYQAQVEKQLALEKEKAQADAAGMTVEEHRLIQGYGGVIDWSKIGREDEAQDSPD